MNRLRNVSTYAVCGMCGIMFGIAAEKGQVYVPSVIRDQMIFARFTMLKMFLPALATSCAVFSFLAVLPVTRHYFVSVRKAFADCLTKQSVLNSMLGGAILGIGMTLSGSCPGMIFVQLGTGTQHAVFTFTGCIAGAILYGMVHSKLNSTENTTDKFLDKLLSVKYVSLAIPFIGLLTFVSLLVDIYFPETKLVLVLANNMIPLISMHSWNPLLSGVVSGALQLPLVLAVKDSLGGSTSYCTLVANGLDTVEQLSTGSFVYFKSFLNNWWQVVYVGGAVLGGALSSMLSGSWGNVEGVSPISGFVGGVCLLFGARLASGCTSGHGISGVALMNGLSLLAVIAMFSGAIATALLMKIFQ